MSQKIYFAKEAVGPVGRGQIFFGIPCELRGFGDLRNRNGIFVHTSPTGSVIPMQKILEISREFKDKVGAKAYYIFKEQLPNLEESTIGVVRVGERDIQDAWQTSTAELLEHLCLNKENFKGWLESWREDGRQEPLLCKNGSKWMHSQVKIK